MEVVIMSIEFQNDAICIYTYRTLKANKFQLYLNRAAQIDYTWIPYYTYEFTALSIALH